MPVIPRNQTTKTLNIRMKLPDTRCALQCIEEEFVESKNSGNFHVHRTWQVIEHAECKVDGQDVDLSGVELEQYLTTKWADGHGGFLPETDSKVKKGIGRVYEDFERLGIQGDIDTDNPQLEAKGKVVDAVIASEEQPLHDAPTPEQIAKGQKRGDVKLDENNKPVMIFRPRIAYIMQLSKVEPQAF